jgi:3-dehydroquinate synthase
MRTIQVNTSESYEVHIAQKLLQQCGSMSESLVKRPDAVALVSDDTVYALYGEVVQRSYEAAGFTTQSFVFPAGENSKNLGTIKRLLDFMADHELTRKDLVVALGGGVVGDIAGFAAAIYLRGISYLQIPTTLLAAVDSSVGGKTGVNLTAGKNLAGSFKQPIAVLCDPDTFATLPSPVFIDGLCEAIKYGCIADAALFDLLDQGNAASSIEDIICACVSIKRDIVQRDEYDHHHRQLLNFGHTAGHAIERLSNYTISHGRAVAMGMRIMAGYTGQMDALLRMFDRYGIDSDCPYTAAMLAGAARFDKKRSGDKITVVLLERIGRAYLETIDVAELEDVFLRGLN